MSEPCTSALVALVQRKSVAGKATEEGAAGKQLFAGGRDQAIAVEGVLHCTTWKDCQPVRSKTGGLSSSQNRSSEV